MLGAPWGSNRTVSALYKLAWIRVETQLKNRQQQRGQTGDIYYVTASLPPIRWVGDRLDIQKS